jgi:DNA-binding ferritin-like protein
MSANTVCFFMTMREQIKLYHWQTKSYSRHKATDNLLDELDKHIDSYVEVYMGKYGRPKLSSRTNTIKLANLSESSIQNFIKKCIQYLIKELPKDLQQQDTDLFNIRDEMLGQLHQLQYLFTLK